MGAAYYIMAILGCSDAGTACQPVRVAETRYESAAACAAAYSAVLRANSDVSFPVVMAQCRRVGRSMAARDEKPRG